MSKSAADSRIERWRRGSPWLAVYRDEIKVQIDEGLVDYMHRWVLQTPFGALRLHKILRPDNQEDPHDHPFDMLVWRLKGTYVEDLLVADCMVRFVRRPSVFPRRIRATDVHQIVELPDGPCWSFVWAGPRRRTWGFHTDNGFVPYYDYGCEP